MRTVNPPAATIGNPTVNTDHTTPNVEEPSSGEPADGALAPGGSSRRSMLRKAAMGVAAVGVAGIATGTRSAAADDGDPLKLGTTNTHTTQTNVNYGGPTVPASTNIQSGDQTAANDGILNTTFGGAGTALLGVASGNGNQSIGIIGWSKKAGGTGLVGFTGAAGAYGGEFFGGLAEIRLRPGGNQPITLTDTHQVGELYEDATGTLWLCVTAGTPGTWREIGGTTSSGAFHAIAPRRVYDSRPDRKLAAGVDRVISVANSTDGTVDVVPRFATAVTLTVTITETEGIGGWVAIRPQDSAFAGTSSINWFGPNQNLATTVVSALGGDRQIIALGGGGNSTHLVVDVAGYYR
jgi:hypothetical protein